jgi:hypothetical protein
MIGAVFDSFAVGERTLARRLLAHLREGMLLMPHPFLLNAAALVFVVFMLARLKVASTPRGPRRAPPAATKPPALAVQAPRSTSPSPPPRLRRNGRRSGPATAAKPTTSQLSPSLQKSYTLLRSWHT